MKIDRHDVPGDDQHLGGHHQGAQNEHKENVFSRKVVLGEGIAGQRIEEDHAQGAQSGTDEAVQVPPREEGFEDNFSVIVKGRCLG